MCLAHNNQLLTLREIILVGPCCLSFFLFSVLRFCFVYLRFVSCVPNVVCVSGLSILYCLFRFLYHLAIFHFLKNFEYLLVFRYFVPTHLALVTFTVGVYLMYYSITCCFRCTFGGRHGRDRMIVGFITTYAINAYHH